MLQIKTILIRSFCYRSTFRWNCSFAVLVAAFKRGLRMIDDVMLT